MIANPAYIRVEGNWKDENGRSDSLSALARAMRMELGKQYAEGVIDSPSVELVTEPMEIGAIRSG